MTRRTHWLKNDFTYAEADKPKSKYTHRHIGAGIMVLIAGILLAYWWFMLPSDERWFVWGGTLYFSGIGLGLIW